MTDLAQQGVNPTPEYKYWYGYYTAPKMISDKWQQSIKNWDENFTLVPVLDIQAWSLLSE